MHHRNNFMFHNNSLKLLESTITKGLREIHKSKKSRKSDTPLAAGNE